MKPLPIQTEVLRPRPANAVRNVRKEFPVYPAMLMISTLLSAAFCILYLTKPVVSITGGGGTPVDEAPAAPELPGTKPPAVPTGESELMPDPGRLPGDPGARVAASKPADRASDLPAGSATSALEETNLKIQHVLSAESPDGELARIVVDVPVLYQSRQLRWSASQVAEAEALLAQLRAHQQQTRALRADGMLLLDAWKSLVARSIPAPALRADSPTLPVNQPAEHANPPPAGRETSESIEVQTADNR